MRTLLLATLCLALSAPVLAQNADTDTATRDDVILYLRTMRSHDMMQRLLEVQSQSMQTMMHDQLMKEKGTLPANFDSVMQKEMADLVKGMPADEIIDAMNTFYASPVGQKVLEELPSVMQEGMQAAMPIMSKYLTEWKGRMQQDLEKLTPPAATPAQK